ncbi:MAG: prepilin-type N-terminal cleavage/methylation domain-containing protein [Myxococcales bacterium]|nr:prepilin-type N-terminal cleavage/methylation domain-containing protein [Myxococcales bacterium]
MTMIEVLVAMAIITMMMVSVWSSFSSTVDGMKATESIQERYATVRNSVDRMSSEIATAYLSFNRPGGETRHYTLFEGRGSADGDNLTFSTFGHLRIRRDSNESDQTVIQYFLDDDPEDASRQHLYRRESPRLTGDKPEDLYRYVPAYVLCEDVESLEFRYWDGVNQEWLDEWRTTTNDAQPDRLPQRVEIKLGVMNRETRKVEYFITQTALPMQEKLDFSK